MSPERAAEVSERSDKDTDRASDPDHTFAFLFAVGGAREQGHRENGRGPTTPTTKTLGVSATTFETRPRGRIGTDVAGKGAGCACFAPRPPAPHCAHSPYSRAALALAFALPKPSVPRGAGSTLSFSPVAHPVMAFPNEMGGRNIEQHFRVLEGQPRQHSSWIKQSAHSLAGEVGAGRE